MIDGRALRARLLNVNRARLLGVHHQQYIQMHYIIATGLYNIISIRKMVSERGGMVE